MKTTTKRQKDPMLNFRRTTIMNDSTAELMSNIIRKESLRLNHQDWDFDSKLQSLINASLDLGLIEVADEMIQMT